MYDHVIYDSSLPTKGEYCIIGLGESRMTGLCQSAGRDYADRCVASDSADTDEGAPRFCRIGILIGLLVEGLI